LEKDYFKTLVPQEFCEFKEGDTKMRKLMQKVNANPKLNQVAMIPELGKTLNEVEHNFEKMRQGIN